MEQEGRGQNEEGVKEGGEFIAVIWYTVITGNIITFHWQTVQVLWLPDYCASQPQRGSASTHGLSRLSRI